MDFSIHDFHIWPQKGTFATEPQRLGHGLPLSTRAGPPSQRPSAHQTPTLPRWLARTPMGEQGHAEDDCCCRGAQPIEHRTCSGAAGFVALMTDESLLLPRMDTNIAAASLASGRAMLIGAACGCRVHDGPAGFVWKHAKRRMTGPPFLLQLSFTTVPCRATFPFSRFTKLLKETVNMPCFVPVSLSDT